MLRLLSAFLLLSVAAFALDPSSVLDASLLRSKFSDYMHRFGKTYKTQEEFRTRLANFEASLKRIDYLNSKSKGGATFGITKFSDVSAEEFKNTILMRNPIDPSKKMKDVGILQPKALDLPVSLDWRNSGLVTAVKDQGQCGSCWAFSATENIESMWIRAGKSKNSTLNLSEQQIVDCDDWDLGCGGGEPYRAYEYIISAGGQEPDRDYPYTAVNGNCNFEKSEISAKISSWKYATSEYSEELLQKNLVSWGPLSVCVDASNWQDYQNGVMTWEQCAWVNLLDHCVQLVGYSTKTADGDYWIVRNSWGLDWGIDGYIWLAMGGDTCGIAHEATCAVV